MGFIGVLYGYGSSEELFRAGALRTVDAPHQLVEFCASEISG
jgi:phosphoglycolate phosphatase-like HAD superfamily hydrolase